MQFLTGKLKTKPKPASGQRPGGKPARKPFPKHWGDPPAIQTRDYRKLPGGYGFGSGTLANWIQKNLEKDVRRKLKAKKMIRIFLQLVKFAALGLGRRIYR